jgi:D-glycero-D-manno-heptose 1,7-bisphosphate phosphatase
VFLDRDGTIIVEKDFLGDPAGVELLPRAAQAIEKLNGNGYLVIVVTNQSGVARGYYDEDAVSAVNARFAEMLKQEGAIIDDIFYCPHYLGGKLPEYSIDCDCRKPKTGLAHRAMEKHRIDLSRSFMVGDRAVDIQFGKNLDLPSILVTTGYGHAEKERIEDERLAPPDFIARDLLEAAEWIMRRGNG